MGILGFVPQITPDGHLLGIFHVNTAHNLVHIVSGIIALMAGLAAEHTSRLYFRWFGVVYGLVALIGIIQGERPLLGITVRTLFPTPCADSGVFHPRTRTVPAEHNKPSYKPNPF